VRCEGETVVLLSFFSVIFFVLTQKQDFSFPNRAHQTLLFYSLANEQTTLKITQNMSACRANASTDKTIEENSAQAHTMQEWKDQGNSAYKKGDFKKAMVCYTCAIRVKHTNPPPVLLKMCWLNRSRTYAAMELWMLAYADIVCVELIFGKPLCEPKDVFTSINYLMKLKLYSKAEEAYARLLQHPDLSATEKTDIASALYMVRALIAKDNAERAMAPERQVVNAQRSFVDKHTFQEMIRHASMYSFCSRRDFFEALHPISSTEQSHYISNLNHKLLNGIAEVQHTDHYGLAVFAVRDFKKDETILVEDATAAAGIATRQRCSNCLRPDASVACAGKCGAVYCNEYCHTTAANEYHKNQCTLSIQTRIRGFQNRIAKTGMTSTSRIPLVLIRLLGSVSREQNVLESSLYLRRLHVPSDEQQLLIEQTLVQYVNMLQLLSLNPAWFDFYTFDYVRIALITNAFALRDDRDAHDTIPFGTALYKTITFFNHACDCNVVHRHDLPAHGSKMILSAAREIKKGEQMFISYIDSSMPLVKRQEVL